MLLTKKSGKIIILIITAAVLLWTIWGNTSVALTCYTVSSSRIPSAFSHYKIAVISDLHNAEFGEDNRHLISMIEKEKPDIIAITGDLVDSGNTDLEVAEKLVKKLVAVAPCYYVTGNHEAWLSRQYNKLEQKLLDAGVTVLHDTSVKLTKDNQTIQLAGLDDPDFTDRDSSIHESMLQTKLERMNLTDDYCILLSHRPEDFNVYLAADIDLVLSGHAHGGQFRLPFIGGLIAPDQGFFPKYDCGKYSEKNTDMIVSRGIGNSIIPVRFNNRPEVVMVELI